MKYCDLHIHSSASDGTFTPEQIVERAYNYRLSGIAITDHDSVAAVPSGIRAAEKFGIEYVPAIEISTSDLEGRMHILGYYIDIGYSGLTRLLKKLVESRKTRVQEICNKIESLGYPCAIEDIENIADGASIGRPHVAEYLIDIGAVRDIHEAFDRYLSVGKPAYVRKWAPSPKEAIGVIHDAGGLAVAAHPGITEGMMDKLPYLYRLGIDGLEGYYPRYPQNKQRRIIEFAREHNLVITGGSDCHGFRRGKPLLGIFKVRYELLEKLRALHGA
ncbi:phosphatase [bacterium]|nr:MAG: phosphatase [bacterium]